MMSSPQERIQRLSRCSKCLCVIGLIISIYAYYVETRKEEDESYEALCDINEFVSCTKAFNSEYGKGFGILKYLTSQNSSLNQPNSIFGIMFYTIHFALEIQNTANAAKLQTIFSIISNMGSVYLTYILVFKVKAFCAVCIVTYIVNALMLYLNYNKFKVLITNQKKRK